MRHDIAKLVNDAYNKNIFDAQGGYYGEKDH